MSEPLHYSLICDPVCIVRQSLLTRNTKSATALIKTLQMQLKKVIISFFVQGCGAYHNALMQAHLKHNMC